MQKTPTYIHVLMKLANNYHGFMALEFQQKKRACLETSHRLSGSYQSGAHTAHY